VSSGAGARVTLDSLGVFVPRFQNKFASRHFVPLALFCLQGFRHPKLSRFSPKVANPLYLSQITIQIFGSNYPDFHLNYPDFYLNYPDFISTIQIFEIRILKLLKLLVFIC